MLKTVYFDLGNVLVFFSFAKMLSQISSCSGLSVDEIKRSLIDHELQIAHETGRMDSVAMYRFFQSKSSKSFSLHEFIAALSDIFTPNTTLWPTIERLKKEGLRLILISNTCESHYNHLYSRYPILRLFDHKILSFEIGSMKPDARIFRKALSLAHCPPPQCFSTYNIPAFVQGARNAGLDAELYTDVPSRQKRLIQRGCPFFACT